LAPAPTNLAAVVLGPTSIALSWSNTATNATGIQVQRALGTNAFSLLASVTAASVAYTDLTAVASSTYSYRLVASNTAGLSLPSATVTATTPAAPVLPAAPTALTAVLSNLNPPAVSLAWVNNATNATSFVVQRAVGTGAYATIATLTGSNVTTYADTTVTLNTTNSYRVAAVNAGGTSAYAPAATVYVGVKFVQAASSAAVASATTVTTPALAASQTAGNLNILVVGWKDTVRTITSVTDNKGAVYTLAGTMTSGTGLRQAIYYSTAVGGTGTTASVTFNGAATSPDVRFLEYYGVKTLDRTGGASGTAQVATVGGTGATANTSVANELVFGACLTSTSVTSAGTGFTSRLTTASGNAEDKVLAATGSWAVSANTGGTTRNWVIQAATFR
jgi:fibronectin type 3 domain-containing protein